MSHPPETSLSSRQLAERIIDTCLFTNNNLGHVEVDFVKAAALIDAYTSERINNIVGKAPSPLTVSSLNYPDMVAQAKFHKDYYDWWESALATARKQLEEKVK